MHSPLDQAIYKNLNARTVYRGEILLPCVPAALGHYLTQVEQLFDNLGRPLLPPEAEQMQQLLATALTQGFTADPSALLVLKYEVTCGAALQRELACSASLVVPSLTEQYAQWSRSAPDCFGTAPDAKVMDLLPDLGAVSTAPITAPILDVGAGQGRNTLAIARLGYPVDALEPTAAFAAQLQAAAAAENLPIQVQQTDILEAQVTLPQGHYALMILAAVISHFRDGDQLRQLFEVASQILRPGGVLLCNCFLAHGGFEPDPLAREMSQVAWSSLFTRGELQAAIADLPLEQISEERVLDYEAHHRPPTDWPPTPWYLDWASGRSAFPLTEVPPPVDLCWLVLRRSPA